MHCDNPLAEYERVDTYCIDGEFVKASEARIPVKDIVVLRGFGVFDFQRTYNSANGITRGVVMELVKEHCSVDMRHIGESELPHAEEVFVTACRGLTTRYGQEQKQEPP